METSRSAKEPGSRLRPWIGWPILGLVVLYFAATDLPSPECGEGGGASSLEMTVFLVLAALPTIGCLGAAISVMTGWRLPKSGTGRASRVVGRVLLPIYLLATALSCMAILFLVLLDQSGSAC